MNNIFRIPISARWLVRAAGCLVCAAIWSANCLGATVVSLETIAAAIADIEAAISESDWKRLDDARQHLIELGPDSLPALLAQMRKEGTTKVLKQEIVIAVSRMPGDKATEALLEIALHEADGAMAEMAGICIDNRIIRIPLSDQDLNSLIRRIETADGRVAAHWAYCLARAEQVDSRKLAAPAVRRLVQAVVSDQVPPVYNDGLYISTEAWYINQFLRPLWYIDSSASLPLLKDAMAATNDSRLRKWLLIARGFAGDAEVANELRQIIENQQEDASVRALALRAYAGARKELALPFLESYLDDATPGPNPKAPPLQIVAKDAIAELRRRQ